MRYLALFFALSIAWTWPLATRLSTRLAHDAGDPVLNAWILWWNTQAVPFTAAWWNAPIFHPAPGTLALSEHLAGVAVFTVPLHVLGASPAAAYNVALILSCWLSAYFAFLLGRHLTGSALGGIVCGLAFGFAPYRAGQLAHLQVLTAQWMPLALYAMHRYVADGGRRWLVVFGVAWVLQALSNGYFLLFFPVLIGLWLVWFPTWRQRVVLGAAFAASSLLLLPTLLKYKEVHDLFGLSRSLGEMLMFSARWQSFLQVPDLLAFWPPLESGATPEGFLFPGVTVVAAVLLGAGMLRQPRSPWLFYVGAALLFWWLSFGPARSDATGEILARPYTLLMWLPGFEGLRVPARFAMLATLCIAVAAAIASVRLTAAAGRARPVVAAVLVAGLLADGWIEPMPLVPVPSRFRMPDVHDALVLELPLDDPLIAATAMYRSIGHGRPLVNGYSGHAPPHHAVLAGALRREDPTALGFLAAGRPLVVLVHRDQDRERGWRHYVESNGGVFQEESGLGPVFVVPPRPRPRAVPIGAPLPVVPHPAGAGYIAVDLGSEQIVRAVVLDLEWRHQEIGVKLLVEASSDDATWTPVWEDWTGALSVAGALEDQRRVPLKITLPDVRTRYLRLSPATEALAKNVRAYGPQ